MNLKESDGGIFRFKDRGIIKVIRGNGPGHSTSKVKLSVCKKETCGPCFNCNKPSSKSTIWFHLATMTKDKLKNVSTSEMGGITDSF